VVLFARIDDLPPEATREKEAARRFGPRSNVTFPLKVGGHVIGAMAFGTVHRDREWPQAIVNRLRLFVEMIGSAIARTHAERALHESENKLRLILDSTAEAIYGVDLEGRCTFCNTACLRTLGYERSEELLGRNMHHLAHQTGGDETIFPSEECGLCRAAFTGKGVHVDNEVLWRANGKSFPVEYWCYPQFRGEEIVGAVVAFLDITPRKVAEAALASVSRNLRDAKEQERGRIARELHDDIGQRLALLAVELDQLHEDLSDLPEVHNRMGDLQMLTSEIATDIQTLSHDLHSGETGISRPSWRHEKPLPRAW
jgi:PAS domain S-box-containing protein